MKINSIKLYLQRLTGKDKRSFVFPSIVLITFLVLIALGISGSSATIYGQLLNGPDFKDKNLLIGIPRAIRSDEWTVTTQMVIAQSAENYPSNNQNIGNGQNMDLILDVPSRDWSQIFRPQNWAFFILPLENAFAFKWWFHSVILLLAVYFFALRFTPKKHLLASFIAISVTFSGFLQWWYGSTLSMVAYVVIISLLYMLFVGTKRASRKIWYTAGISYAALCFGVMLYPPFQIPCAIILLGFLVGYSVYKFKLKNFWTLIKNSWIYITCAIICVAAVFGLFVYDHKDVISIEQSTAYPGARVVQSGGYSFTHLFSGSLAPQQLRPGHAANYQDAAASATNQSESSTFIFISTFLILPLLYIFIKEKKNNLKKRYIYVAASLTLAGAVLIAWLFIPGLSLLGSILKLSMVTQNRAIMGLGFLNLLFLVTFIWAYRNSDMKISIKKSIIYSLCVFLFTAVIHLDIHRLMPQFIDSKLALLLAIPVPIIVFLLLRKKFTFALGILAIFTLMGGALVNPLYKGLSVMTSNQLINAVKSSPDDNNYWIAENIYLENIASMAGRHSLSGVYTYPQVSLWKKIDNGADSARYNRYAHVSFNFDKNPLSKIQTGFVDSGPDQLVIKTELCSDFLKQSNVTHVISTALYSKDDQTCILNTRSVKMGDYSYYIYSLQWN